MGATKVALATYYTSQVLEPRGLIAASTSCKTYCIPIPTPEAALLPLLLFPPLFSSITCVI